MFVYGESVSDFGVGGRVALRPGYDPWLRGDRGGVVVHLCRSSVLVRLDRSGRLAAVIPQNLALA